MKKILTRLTISILILFAGGIPTGMAQDAPIDDILKSLPAGAGVCVHLGDGDGSFLTSLAKKQPGLVIHGLRTDNAKVKAARQTLEKAGVKFIEQNGGGPGVRLKKRKRR